jgi:hypothetical protein
MRTVRQVKTTAPAILPLLMLLVPKCPLCLMPLFAAAGLALPRQGLLDAFLVAAAAAWLAFLASGTRSIAVFAPALSGAALLLGGRWLDFPAAGWAGVLLMLAAAAGAAARRPSCNRSCPAPVNEV